MENKAALLLVRTVLELNFPGRRFTDKQVRQCAETAFPFADLATNTAAYRESSKLTPELVLLEGTQQGSANSAGLFEALKTLGGK